MNWPIDAARSVRVMTLALALVGTNVARSHAGEPSPGQQVATSSIVKVIDGDGHEREVTLRYWLFVPIDYAADEAKLWPLVLFLHGSGERGDDLALVKKHGPPKFLDDRPDFPAVAISPQCPKDQRCAG